MKNSKSIYILSILFFGFVSVISKSTSPSTKETKSWSNNDWQAPSFRPSVIEDAEMPIQVTVGDKFRIACSARGKPKPQIHYYKDLRLLGRSSKDNDPEISSLLKRVDFFPKSLKVNDVIMQDTGQYRCVAINEAGNSTLTYYVIVNDTNAEDAVSKDTAVVDEKFPHWLQPEKMLKVLHAEPAGNTVHFKCLVGGEDPISVTWYKDGKQFKKKDRLGGYKFRQNSQLIVLESVVLSDKGVFMCVATNDYGSINHTYVLDVAERSAHRPILQYGLPSNKTKHVGEDVTFHCKVFSDSHPHIQWVKAITVNGSKIDPKTNTSYIKILKKAGVNTTDEEMESLTLKNVTYEDAGEYTCLAGNSIGFSFQNAWLMVIPEPRPTKSPITPNTHYLIYILATVCFVFMIILLVYLIRSYYNNKDVPKLVPIDNFESIPQMDKMEEPMMLIGNDQAWRRMCFPSDHFEINIQTDLQWELKREDILLHERIDEGFFGQVYKADLIQIQNGRKEKVTAAVKMLKSSRTEKDMLDLLMEMDQMKRVGKHQNIINLLGVCTQNGILWLVTEYAQQGNLRDYLRRNRPSDMQYHLTDPNATQVQPPRSEPLSYKDLMSAAYQVARGMDYLSQKKCVHRDLAARNVLVSDDYVMKIADFGLARDIRSNDYYRKHTRGHLPYKWMALEAMTDNVFTDATDVWSFAVLLWEIFTLGGSPYPGVKTHELVRFLRHGERLEHPQFASHELYRLMRDCWEENPQKRPKFRQLVEDLDRMLAESSSEEYIDLSCGCDADFMVSDSDEESEADESSRDSANATGEDSDSVFEHHHPLLPSNDNDQFVDGEERLLLNNHNGGNIVCNGHARIQSDV